MSAFTIDSRCIALLRNGVENNAFTACFNLTSRTIFLHPLTPAGDRNSAYPVEEGVTTITHVSNPPGPTGHRQLCTLYGQAEAECGGFAVTKLNARTIEFTWNSGTLNDRHYSSRVVPASARRPVEAAFSEFTIQNPTPAPNSSWCNIL